MRYDHDYDRRAYVTLSMSTGRENSSSGLRCNIVATTIKV